MLELEYEEIEARAELKPSAGEAAAIDPRVWVERRIEQVFLADENVRGLREALRTSRCRSTRPRAGSATRPTRPSPG